MGVHEVLLRGLDGREEAVPIRAFETSPGKFVLPEKVDVSVMVDLHPPFNATGTKSRTGCVEIRSYVYNGVIRDGKPVYTEQDKSSSTSTQAPKIGSPSLKQS